MSLSSLFFFGACWLSYRIGAFNERHPGELRRRSIHVWHWFCDWFQKGG